MAPPGVGSAIVRHRVPDKGVDAVKSTYNPVGSCSRGRGMRGRYSDLSRHIAWPSQLRRANGFGSLSGRLTAAGTVPDSHRIPCDGTPSRHDAAKLAIFFDKEKSRPGILPRTPCSVVLKFHRNYFVSQSPADSGQLIPTYSNNSQPFLGRHII